MESKSVTVVIATYNRWPIICEAVDSILAQSYPHTRCLVVDDASTDGTAEKLAQKYGEAIDVVAQQANRGQSACRNIGVQTAQSDCVCFLDSDDVLLPNAVTSRVSLLNEQPDAIRVAFGFIKTSDAKALQLLHQKKRGETLLLSEYLKDTGWCHNNGFLIEREIFLKHGMYNVQLRNKEDVELLIRLLADIPFCYCGEEIGEVRNVDNRQRARNDYDKIIRQGTLFSEILSDNPILKAHFDAKELHAFLCTDVQETLRAMYKSCHYRDFRRYYRQAVKEGRVRDSSKFFRRYLLSFVKQLFESPKAGDRAGKVTE